MPIGRFHSESTQPGGREVPKVIIGARSVHQPKLVAKMPTAKSTRDVLFDVFLLEQVLGVLDWTQNWYNAQVRKSLPGHRYCSHLQPFQSLEIEERVRILGVTDVWPYRRQYGAR